MSILHAKYTNLSANLNKLTEKTSTTLSLTVTLSVVEECLKPTFIEFYFKLIDIGQKGRQAIRNEKLESFVQCLNS